VLPELEPYVMEASKSYGVDPNLIRAIIEHESSGGRNLRATGSSAYGPMQLIAGTAKELGVNRYNPRENILGGAR
jgi:soluble lytic murein transglycosylase-like protein